MDYPYFILQVYIIIIIAIIVIIIILILIDITCIHDGGSRFTLWSVRIDQY